MHYPLAAHCRYTALFCEENVWWLVRDLVDRGFAAQSIDAVLFSNRPRQVRLRHQRVAVPGATVAWDYHAVVLLREGGRAWIFDLDSRLPFPSPASHYLESTFSAERGLSDTLRALARVVPAASYLARFHSERRHMLGQVPAQAFPDYPPITAPAENRPITLLDYLDLDRLLDDGSRVLTVEALQSALAADD